MSEQLQALYEQAMQALQKVELEIVPNAKNQDDLARGLQLEIELNRVAAILRDLLPGEGAS